MPVVMALLVWGCGSDSTDEPQAPELTIVEDETRQPFADTGGTAQVTFTANMAWQASADQYWCEVSPMRGEAGTVTLTVTVAPNEEVDDRLATLEIACGTLTKRFELTQRQKDAILLSASQQEVQAEGGEIMIEVMANVDFDVEIAPKAADWITPVEADTRALEQTLLAFSIAPNTETEPREGIIRISNGTLTETVTVSQEGEAPVLQLNQTHFDLGAEGGSFQVEVQSNRPYAIEMPQVDWLRELTTRTVSAEIHEFVADANPASESRTAEIVFVDEESGLREVVTVQQSGYEQPFITLSQTYFEAKASGDDFRVMAQSNVDYDVTVTADWISETTTRATELNAHNFHIEPNQSLERREAQIVFSASVVTGEAIQEIRAELTVTQEPIDVVIVEQTHYEVPASGGVVEIPVQTSLGFETYAEDYSWLSWYVFQDDAQHHRLRVEVNGNQSGEERTATFTLQPYFGGEEVTITLTQAASSAVGGGIDDLPHVGW